MHIGILVSTKRTCDAVHTYTLLEILDEGAEITHQVLPRSHTQKQALDIFGSYSFSYCRLFLIDM